METIPDTAAESIKEIERLAKDASRVQTITLQVPDGGGGTVNFPVLVDREGNASGLITEAREAAQLTKELRLASALKPDRREGTANHQAFKSFLEHVNRFKSEASAVWADVRNRMLVAVLDYHPAGAKADPAWQRHRAVYPAPLSEAFCAWGGLSGLKLTQEQFSDLLDERDRELQGGTLPGTDVAAPTPAQLVTLATNLEVYANTSVKRARDPNTGRLKLTFVEEKGVAGELTPPKSFLIAIPVFQDLPPEPLEVRLRVDVIDGAAKFLVHIHAASEVLRAAFDDLCDDARKDTGLPVFVGTSES